VPWIEYSDGATVTLGGRSLHPIFFLPAAWSRAMRRRQRFLLAMLEDGLPIQHAGSVLVEALFKPMAHGLPHPCAPGQLVVLPLLMMQGDMPELNGWLRLYANHACRVCLRDTEAGNGTHRVGTLRTTRDTIRAENNARAAFQHHGTKGDAKAALQQRQQLLGVSPLLELRFFWPFNSTPAGPGHYMLLGNTHDLLLFCIERALLLADNAEDCATVINTRARRLTSSSSATHNRTFTSTRSNLVQTARAKRLIGSEVATLCDIAPLLFHNQLDAKCERLLLLHVALAAAFTQCQWTEPEVRDLKRLLQREDELRAKVCADDTPKRHEPQHIIEFIRRFGNLLNISELELEAFHQPLKREAQRTNNRQRDGARMDAGVFETDVQHARERLVHGNVSAQLDELLARAALRQHAQHDQKRHRLAGARKIDQWGTPATDERTRALLRRHTPAEQADAAAQQWRPRVTPYTTAYLPNSCNVRSAASWRGEERRDSVLLDDGEAHAAGLHSPWARLVCLFTCSLLNGQEQEWALVRGYTVCSFNVQAAMPQLRLDTVSTAVPLLALRCRVQVAGVRADGALAVDSLRATTLFLLDWWVAHGEMTYPHQHRSSKLASDFFAEWEQVLNGTREHDKAKAERHARAHDE
jgi:hypothetical protein